ncbi:phage Gp37/Gp68 family protein [Laspinema olomoucense]|uniref:phage Gp37/Gp68 family protein n=1 Tax=Laspinema olomoucense TaxID=3231600 RepID=UPI0021BAA97F|nr:phage Gp37/Gp68 family protein [Laspinema sp. D3c]MCT7992529.1 phage Gp37/Gp68 family protein [Laspinema sp. D3c]
MSTKISWTDETWNSVVGCSRISPGCALCYASEAAKSPRLQQFSQYQKVGKWDGTVEFVESQLLKPLKWKKPKKIFVCSMSDIFHKNVPFEWIDKIFAIMAIANQHTFQILTKRPERMLEYLSDSATPNRIEEAGYEWSHNMDFDWPLNNVWVGTSVENQEMADKRIPYLIQVPAKIRFLSCEPLLGKLDLGNHLVCNYCHGNGRKLQVKHGYKCGTAKFVDCPECGNNLWNDKIRWIICGGESGFNARPCRVEWIQFIVRQCSDAKIACFVKQLGAKPYLGSEDYLPGINTVNLHDRKGGNPDEWPDDLKVQQFPRF